jgi:hypothetical protein
MRRRSVVNQHGKAAERRYRELEQLLGLQLVSNICAEERSSPAILFNETDRCVAARFVDVGNDNGGAIPGEPSSNGATAT